MSALLFFIMMSACLFGHSLEVQGHRGARGIFPENTLTAFAAAIQSGADVLELDLLFTKDAECVIYHDFCINPQLTTYLDGTPLTSALPICSLCLAEVKKFDCGRQVNPLFPRQQSIPGTQIPTLPELFTFIQTLNANKIRLNLEIKRDALEPELSATPFEIVKRLLNLVDSHAMQDRVYYSSFDQEVLFELRRQAPHAKIAFLKEDTLENMVEIATALAAEIVSPDESLIHEAADIHYLQQKGFKVILWTVNDPDRWAELIDMGVDGIITDYPDELIAFLTQLTQKRGEAANEKF